MSNPALSPHPLTRTAHTIAPRGVYLIVAAVLMGAGAWFMGDGIVALAVFAAAGTFAALAGLTSALASRHGRADSDLQEQIAEFIEHDASPSFMTNEEGEIGTQNRAALDRFGSKGGQTLTRALAEVFASPAAVLHRLQNRAEALGSAREDLVTRRGHVRLAVHRIGDTRFLWRLEDMAERSNGGRGAETISLPMLTASKTGTVLFMNEALRKLVGQRVKTLDRVFTELPVQSGEEMEVAGADGPVRTLISVIDGTGGRQEIYFLPAPEHGRAYAGDPTAFDTLPVALLKIRMDGTLSESNRAARALLGEVEPGTSVSELLEGLGRPVNDWLADALSGRADCRPEVLRVRGKDQDVYLQVTLTRTVEDGRPALLAILSDATQLKTLEAQFVQSQKMQAIGQLAGGVAHDFNNLLTAISGHCDLLLLRHDKGDPDYADLVQINQNANRAASLVGQLLAFSRKQTLKPEVIDLRDTLSDLTHLLNRLVGERVRLALNHDPDLSPIRADKRQLEQVIMNLVVNARDAMPTGGEIRIETESLTLTEALSRDRARVTPGDYVVVRVTDEGTGIAQESLQKIFEPFYTTKRQGEGTGLGLSTAYGIIKQTGGFIFCDSVPGQGTTFTLYFPAHSRGEEAESEAPTRPAPRRAPRVGEGVVLLVEDEAPVRAFASRALRMRGYTVIEAENAEEALKTLEDAALSVDVFVTDVIMPGMDGPSWVREALKDRPDTRVVFVSGYSEESLTETRDRIPNSVFLPKPFSLSELTATVQGQLH
ncbi:Sensor kinase CckA [Defluviimonas aquaemixtae]|uniref:histidine kinase n=2 Tax=Albidovulum aquaemixtae TaxID=1542388 RepID=A0A2R8B5F5_9RHOB|nr:ATP-binding protein [Defluviimonas aquaemixtae]SPH17763.1 Sensor kinase CckA [Defluviimonas aquaemixtae]